MIRLQATVSLLTIGKKHIIFVGIFSNQEQKLIIFAMVLFPLLCSPIKTLTLFNSMSTFLMGPMFLIINRAISLDFLCLQIYNIKLNPPKIKGYFWWIHLFCKIILQFHALDA